MQGVLQAVTSDVLHLIIGSIIGVLLLAFLWMVVLRGVVQWWSLHRIRSRLKQIRKQEPSVAKAELRKLFEPTRLSPLWQEYGDTLHEQRGSGASPAASGAIRATVPAETFFNGELVVDGRLHSEFFKHMPGIFTGLGIIATFSGLISGLQAFDVTAVDPDALKASLAGLFEYVRSAFYLSAIAIGLAMLSTIVEKLIYAANLHQTSAIAADLDGMFRAGVGEEYLSELVRSSADGAAQTKQLKESLVEDLKVLLTNLTERQIQATQQLSVDLGAEMGRALKEPLEKIAGTVDQASRDQTHSASQVLENLMTAFMAQMRDSMGGQMSELSGMMRQTAESIERVEASLRSLVGDMHQASRSSTEGVQDAMRQLLDSLAAHEREQRESASTAQVQVLAQIQSSMDRMVAAQEAASQQVNSAAERASDRIGDASEKALRAGSEATARATEFAESLQRTSLDAIGKLEGGAERIATMLAALESATERLGRSGTALATLHEKAGALGAQLEKASTALGKSSDTLGSGSHALAQASIRMEGVSSLMASEAGARESAMKEVQLALAKGQEAARGFADYSEQVTKGLEEAIGKFGQGTNTVLEKSLTQFDKELGNAVQLLRQVIDQLTVIAVADKAE